MTDASSNRTAPVGVRRVLVVDDDDMACRSLARLLVRLGFDVREAPSARAALESMAAAPADLVISDFAMPGDDGVALLTKIADEWPDTLRVFYSATVPNARIRHALERGVARQHFTKGDHLEGLLDFVRAAGGSSG
ncbi:MAG TPA: response regulator [Myxococcota bacterium]|jgi:CheY-like chemotaxis protein|nr:response regulator [Myxococcota bacterium]